MQKMLPWVLSIEPRTFQAFGGMYYETNVNHRQRVGNQVMVRCGDVRHVSSSQIDAAQVESLKR